MEHFDYEIEIIFYGFFLRVSCILLDCSDNNECMYTCTGINIYCV